MIKNLLLLFFVSICFSSYGQIPHFTLVTTAFSKDTAGGNDMEYLQLLVDGKKSCSETKGGDSIANISNFVIYDGHGDLTYNNGTVPGIASGYYRFPNTPTWDSVPYGSIIVVYNDKNKNTAALTYADDSTGTIKPHVYMVPVSWLELSPSSPFAFDSLNTILPVPPAINLGLGQNAFLNTPIYSDTIKYHTPQYPPFNRNDSVKWTVVQANITNETPGSFNNKLLISWVDSINKSLGVPVFKVTIDTTYDNSCSAAVILKVNTPLTANSLTYEWWINDTLVTSNSTNTLIDTLRNRDYIALKVTTSLACVANHKTFDSSLVFYSPGFLQVAVTPNIVGQNVSIDSIGKDLHGNIDSSKVFKSFFCSSDTITFSAIPNHPNVGDTYQWLVNHTPVSKDSIFKDTLVKNLDTIQCILASGLQCGVNPLIDTTTIYIFKNSPLNTIKIPKITISGLTGISGDKVIDVYFKDTFSVKFHYDSTLKGVNGLDSIISIDSTTKITTKNCDSKLKDTIITYDTTFAHYVDSSTRYRLVWVLNGVPIDTSITFKDGDHIPSFPYSNFYNAQDTIQCILLAKKTSSCPYDQDFTLKEASNKMILQNQSFHLLTTSLARGVNDGEYIQLIVGGTRDCNEKNKKFLYQANLSGFVIYDKNGASSYSTTNSYGLASGHYRFRSKPGEWYTKVPFGSIILIHNDPPYSNSLIGYGDETTGTAVPFIAGFASKSNVYIIPRSALELIPDAQLQIPPSVLRSNFSSPSSLNLKDGQIAYLNSRITAPFVNSDSCIWASHWSSGLDGATLDFAGYFPNSKPDLQNWQKEYLSYGVVPDIKLVSTEDLDATNINCNPIRIHYSLNSSAVAKLDTVIWYIRHFDTLATKRSFPTNSFKDTVIFNSGSIMAVSPDSAKSYNHKDSSYSQVHYKDELFAYVHSPYYCILNNGEPQITRPIIKPIISANETWTIPYVDSVSISINTDEPDNLHYLKPIRGTDTVGTDGFGNRINTRIYKTFCKGDTIRLNAVSTPIDISRKFSYSWFRLSGNVQTFLNHVPDIIYHKLDGTDSTISMDSVFDDKTIPSGALYDTLICTLHNSQTCAIPYISDTVYIRLLDSIPIPTITISGMKGIDNDTNICSAMTDSFSVAFHYVADTIRAADGSPLKAIDGITDSVVYKKDTTTRYALVWEVWNASSQPQVRNSVYYNPNDPAYHPYSDPLSVNLLDSTIYSDDSTGAKTIRDSIGFLYNKFVAMPNALQKGDSVRCILLARKTNSCPYDKDSFLVSPFMVFPYGSSARDSILSDTTSPVTPLRAYSNTKVMNITPSFTPTIKIFTRDNQPTQFLCPNDILTRRNRQDSVIFWATDSVSSAGDRPSYVWFVDSAGSRRILDSTYHPTANAYLYDSSIHNGTDSNYAISFHRDSADLNIPPSTIPKKDTISFQNFYGGNTYKHLYPGDTLGVKLINTNSNCLLFDSAVARIPLDTLSPVLKASIIPVEPQLICAYDTLITTKYFKDTVTNSSKNAPYPPRYWWVSNNGNITWMDTLSGNSADTFRYKPVLHTGDSVYMKVFSNIACIQNDSIVALPYVVNINPNFYDSVSLIPRDTLCYGVPHSVSAILSSNTNTESPSFDWYLYDGGSWKKVAQGVGSSYQFNTNSSNTGVSDSLHDGDSVMCIMTPNATCYVLTKSDTSNVTVFHVNPLPIVNPITGPTVICVGSFKNLVETTPKGVWSSNDISTLTVDQTGQIKGVNGGSGAVVYTVTDSNNCVKATDPYPITVNANPDLNIFNANSPLCLGSTEQLTTANGAGVWSSSNSAIATVDYTGMVTPVKQGTVSFINTFTDIACGTTVRITPSPIVIGAPLLDTIKGVHSLCTIGTSTTFTNDSTGGFWTSSNTSVATIDNNGLVTANALGYTNITYTSQNNCGQTIQSYDFTVGIPIIGVTSGQDTICKGFGVVLNNSAPAGGGVWTSSNPLIAKVDAVSGLVRGVNPGDVTITYTMSNSCGSDSAKFQMNVQDTLLIEPIVGDSVVCPGGKNLQLSHPIPNGYWLSSDNTIATVDQTGLVTTSNDYNLKGLITISYVISNKCGIDTLKHDVIVGPPIIGVYTYRNPICLHDTLKLTNYTRGATAYEWSVGSNAILTSNNKYCDTVYAIAPGTSRVFYNPTNACPAQIWDQTWLTVLDTPRIATIQGVNRLCLNTFSTYKDDTLKGVWQSSDTTVATITSSGIVNGVAAGNVIIGYKLAHLTIDATIPNRRSDSTTCYNTAYKAIVVDTLPILPVITGNDTACFGRTTALTNAYNGARGNWKGIWSSAAPLIASVDSLKGIVTGIIGNKSDSTKISYTVTDGYGCKKSTDTLIYVNPIPKVPNISVIDSICIGSSRNLTDAVANGIWSSSDTAIAKVDSLSGSVFGKNTGVANVSYKVTVLGCDSTVMESVKIVNTNNKVEEITGIKDSICLNSLTTLNNTTLSVDSMKWATDTKTIAIITDTAFHSATIKGVGIGTAIIRDSVFNFCGITTKTFSLNISAPTLNPIIGNDSLCKGSTTVFTSPYSSTLSWSGVWKSADTLIAKVDSVSGTVLGVKAGQTKIRYTVDSLGCKQTIDTFVIIKPLPVIAPVAGNNSLCINAFINLSDVTAGGVWLSSDTTIATVDSILGKVIGKDSGTAKISYKVTQLGCDNYANLSLKVNANNIAQITGPTNMCRSTQKVFYNLTQNSFSFKWSIATSSIDSIVKGINNLDSVIVFAKEVGTDTIRCRVQNNCGYTDTAFVFQIGAPNVDKIMGKDSICVGDSIPYTSLTSPNSSRTGVWNVMNNVVNSATIDAFGKLAANKVGIDTINYTVTVVDNGVYQGCATTVSKVIVIDSVPTVTDIVGKDTLCEKYATQLQSTPLNGNWTISNPTLASIDGLGNVTAADNLTQGTSDSVNVNYTVSNSYGCKTTKGYKIYLYPNPIVGPIYSDSPFRVHVGLTIRLKDDTLGVNRMWYSANSDYLIFENKDSGIVTGGNTVGTGTAFYKVFDKHGCYDSVKVDIQTLYKLNDVYVPNYFAPDANYIENRTFSVYGKYAKSLDLKIFNQWGEVVYSFYSSKGADGNKWDGRYKGEMQPSGVYVYVARMVLESGETVVKKGSVNLIR